MNLLCKLYKVIKKYLVLKWHLVNTEISSNHGQISGCIAYLRLMNNLMQELFGSAIKFFVALLSVRYDKTVWAWD